jgi:hypothetical protein
LTRGVGLGGTANDNEMRPEGAEIKAFLWQRQTVKRLWKMRWQKASYAAR